jgi:galactokinase
LSKRSFLDVFARAPQVAAHAHGRVNLLGEHTDYNDGYVLPTIIQQRTIVQLAHSKEGRWHYYSENLGEHIEYLENGGTAPTGFGRYVFGCVEVLQQRVGKIPPLMVHICSDVPMASGLSSSAALEVALLRALRTLLQLEFDDVELARLAQRAENEYAGVRCGILDQMACSLGGARQMLFLDTRTLERCLLPLPAGEVLVIDSGVPRTLASSGYNQRRAECESAARLLGVQALRDVVSWTQLAGLPAPLAARARHVVSENQRVLAAVKGVAAREFGVMMNASHASLRDDYEVSIAPLDTLVDLLQKHPRIYGARLTGAGFGGACVALAHAGHGASAAGQVLRSYANLGYAGRLLA